MSRTCLRRVALSLLSLACLAGCRVAPASPLALQSAAFADGEGIPVEHTCDGQNVSPPLAWGQPPDGTRSFTLVMDDPDARGWVHWVVFNLPAEARGLPEGDRRGDAPSRWRNARAR